MVEDRFSGFIAFADRVWEEVEQGQRSAQKFKYLLGVISQTLATTHSMVLERLQTIEEAETPEEAERLLEQIRTDQLAEAFRVEGLCDTLGGLGQGLLNRAWGERQKGVFSDQELSEIEVFAQMLYDQERKVATAYAEALSAITDCAAPDASALPAFKDRVRELERRMTAQVVDFRAKATKFMSIAG